MCDVIQELVDRVDRKARRRKTNGMKQGLTEWEEIYQFSGQKIHFWFSK